jgi:toxin ParE1/3/4
MDFKLARVAKDDLCDITDYYADINPDLADRFIQELNSVLLTLCRHPEMGSRRYAHFLPAQSLRVWQLDRFPFLIFYRIDSEQVTVQRILHERRDISAGLISR